MVSWQGETDKSTITEEDFYTHLLEIDRTTEPKNKKNNDTEDWKI